MRTRSRKQLSFVSGERLKTDIAITVDQLH